MESQNSYIKKRWNIKAGFSNLKDEKYRASLMELKNVRNYRIEVNYGILNNFEIGAYIGYSLFEVKYIHPNYDFSFRDASTPFYGINTNFHILPIFISKEDFRFDFYIFRKAWRVLCHRS
jgi:hypothetical protein